jgi:tetratricopeptide (TPR) repeat protein
VLVVVAVIKTMNQSTEIRDTNANPEVKPPIDDSRPTPDGPPDVERHLAEARRLIDAGQAERALNDHIDPILKIDAANERAQKLRREAEDKLIATPKPRPAPPTPTLPPTTAGRRAPPAAVERPVDTRTIPRRAGENPVDYAARTQRIQQHYAAGQSAFEKGEMLDAIGQFEALHRDQAGYMDSVKLLADAQQRRKADASHALEVATRAEESGLLLDALPAYERARRYDPSPAIDEKIARLHERMKEEGAKAYNDARKLDAFGKAKEAIDLYHRAISLLPPEDDRRKEAAKRLETLAK